MSVIQIHTGDGASFPRIPVVYLEAGFALLKAKRYSDALVVCEEVITSTLDFIPERLLLDADEQQNVADSDVVLENVDLVLWAGAAHLLQAQAHWKLKDSKEAITNFTRCIHFVPSCVGKPCFVKCVIVFMFSFFPFRAIHNLVKVLIKQKGNNLSLSYCCSNTIVCSY